MKDLQSVPIQDLPKEFLEKWGGVDSILKIMFLAFFHHSTLAKAEYERMLDDLKTYEKSGDT